MKVSQIKHSFKNSCLMTISLVAFVGISSPLHANTLVIQSMEKVLADAPQVLGAIKSALGGSGGVAANQIESLLGALVSSSGKSASELTTKDLELIFGPNIKSVTKPEQVQAALQSSIANLSAQAQSRPELFCEACKTPVRQGGQTILVPGRVSVFAERHMLPVTSDTTATTYAAKLTGDILGYAHGPGPKPTSTIYTKAIDLARDATKLRSGGKADAPFIHQATMLKEMAAVDNLVRNKIDGSTPIRRNFVQAAQSFITEGDKLSLDTASINVAELFLTPLSPGAMQGYGKLLAGATAKGSDIKSRTVALVKAFDGLVAQAEKNGELKGLLGDAYAEFKKKGCLGLPKN